MTKFLVVFPAADTQVCRNCNTTLGIENLYRNLIDMTSDASGMPAVMVKCPVCKIPLEWETRSN